MQPYKPHIYKNIIQPQETEETIEKYEDETELLEFLADNIAIARSEKQAECIAGNIVQEAQWQGRIFAYIQITSFLLDKHPNSKEINET